MTAEANAVNIVFLADTHLGFDYPVRPRSDRVRRGADFFNNFYAVLSYAKEQKADLLLHGGDLFFRSKVHLSIVDRAYQALSDIAEAGIPVVLVPGNHERSLLPQSLFLAHKNIFVFDRPSTFQFHINGLRLALSGFPSVRDNIRTEFPLKLDKTGYRQIQSYVHLLCVHQALEGARVGPANFTFRNRPDTIRLEDIPDKFDAVCSGHIHRHQILNNKAAVDGKSVPVIYPGSIERTSFAEKDEDKGFMHLTFKQGKDSEFRFIPLPARPMINIELDSAKTAQSNEAELKVRLDDLPSNSIVRISYKKAKPTKTLPQLGATQIKSITPPGMIIQMSRSLFIHKNSTIVHRTSFSHKELLKRVQQEVPTTSGVYLFGNGRNWIYVGKSINLKQRMSSYFQPAAKLADDRLRQMISSVRGFTFIETRSELLALLLEDTMIKNDRPEFNIKQQEYGAYQFLKLTYDRYPALITINFAQSKTDSGMIFGPFRDRYRSDDLRRLISQHLNLRQCVDPEPIQKSMNYDFGICRGPCRGKISPQEYATITKQVERFLNGDEQVMIFKIQSAMHKASEMLEFEKAAVLKKDIEFCENFCRRQRFINRFKSAKLEMSAPGEKYIFDCGQLIRARTGDISISAEGLQKYNLNMDDSRFLFDRAGIVYRWLRQDTRHKAFWS